MKKIVALIMASLIALPAAAEYECNVKVLKVLANRDGTINVLHSGRGEYTHICTLNGYRDGASPTTCAMWTGMLQAIMKKNGTANFYYNGDGSCATLPVYSAAPTPAYVGDVTAP